MTRKQPIGPARIMGIRAMEMLVMSIVASAFSTYIAVQVLQTKVEYIEKNTSQLAGDIRELRNHILERDSTSGYRRPPSKP